jgi:integrase
MRNPNGYGALIKMPGNRRRPWRVRLTAGWEVTPEGKTKQLYHNLGYYATRKEAMQALAEYNNNPYDLASKKITFEYCYNAWAPKHYEKYKGAAPGLKAVYKLCVHIKDIPMADIRLKHLQDLMDSIADKSVTMQTKLKTVFLRTFKFALENDIIQKDYSQFVTITQTPTKQDIKSKFFTKEEIKNVFANKDWIVSYPTAKKSYADIQLVDSVIVQLYTGTRVSELLGIKCEDIDLAKRTIHVRGTKTDAADRLVPIHRDLVPYLEARLAEGNEYLFTNANGKPFKPVPYRSYFFMPFMEHIGSTHTTHALRHTFISIMDRCGVPAESVVLKRIVGHSNKTVTEHYTHKEIEELIEAIDKFKL